MLAVSEVKGAVLYYKQLSAGTKSPVGMPAESASAESDLVMTIRIAMMMRTSLCSRGASRLSGKPSQRVCLPTPSLRPPDPTNHQSPDQTPQNTGETGRTKENRTNLGLPNRSANPQVLTRTSSSPSMPRSAQLWRSSVSCPASRAPRPLDPNT